MNKLYLFILFIVYIYVAISLFEWLAHYYLMHYNGFVKPILQQWNIGTDNSHIAHHKETKLDQRLPDNYIEEGLVFNLVDSEVFYIVVFLLLSVYLFWLFFPTFRSAFSLPFVLGITFIIGIIYLYIWSSIHSHYHDRYVKCNQPLTNNPSITIYSPIPFFVPSESMPIYKYLYWYHTLHHLNKGECKGNYNIIFPLFDFIFGTYKYNVDNTLYFSKHPDTTSQEKWLKTHLIFDIRVMDNNNIEYRDKGSDQWEKLPEV